MKRLRIAGLNFDIRWKEKKFNFQQIEACFKNTEADLFLLPEMFATGFSMEPEEIADRQDESLTWMKSFAKNQNTAVCGSVSVEEDGKFYNRMYFVKPDETYHQYDKRHLFSFSGEDKVYSPGKERIVVEYLGVKILLQICYDLRFPVFSRSNGDYDLALYVANWPEKRVEAWEHLLKARAIENQAYVFGLNRIGIDGNNLVYRESSHCFFADGSEVSEKSGNIISADIDLEKLQKFRSHFTFLKDRDDFEIKLNF